MTLCTCKHFVPTCHYSETQVAEFVASLHGFALVLRVVAIMKTPLRKPEDKEKEHGGHTSKSNKGLTFGQYLKYQPRGCSTSDHWYEESWEELQIKRHERGFTRQQR